MCFLYSSSVVAPMQRSSPRLSCGLSRLLASIAPPVAPAPTTVWISSMNRIMFPSAPSTSFITALRRSSNSPRYLAPATREPMSRLMSERPRRDSGTSPLTMRCAKPSATAVFPTPGSPMSTGLFFVRRLRIWMHLRISSSRPMTGSSFPSRARCVRSVAYRPSASNFSSGFWSCTVDPPRTCAAAFSSTSRVSPAGFSTPSPSRVSSAMFTSSWSTETNLSPCDFAVALAALMSASRFLPMTWLSADAPDTVGCLLRKFSVLAST
mmetsp:Transcript_5799/g.14878  ORF Transcript_5799/g.14878 Transcript_5799/m.14878 type:complete len:266 (-) Transcript_5799:385-1182(-)